MLKHPNYILKKCRAKLQILDTKCSKTFVHLEKLYYINKYKLHPVLHLNIFVYKNQVR